MNDWLSLLTQAVKAQSISAVAKKLGYSRTAISLVMAGKYPSEMNNIAQKVLAVYGGVCCPFLQQDISATACADYAGQAFPSWNQAKLYHWQACQNCPFNPHKKGGGHD